MAPSNDFSSSIFRKPQPSKVLRSELNQLIKMLQASDASMIKFGEAVSRHPVVLKQIMRAANSSLTGSAVEITEPAHAALFLGTRRVVFLLNTLPPEIIEEDVADAEES
jgi:HD-like signal output (HDOD) protein